MKIMTTEPKTEWECPECDGKGYSGHEWDDTAKACENRFCLRQRLRAVEDANWNHDVVENGLVSRGACYERTKHNPREAAFAHEWEEENEAKRHLNYGRGILQDLLSTPDKHFGGHGVGNPQIWLTPAMRYVTATAVQWLGSNCGWRFLEMALKRCGYKIVKIAHGEPRS
jgi:hypothetical protein